MTCDIQIEGKGCGKERRWKAVCRTHQHRIGWLFHTRPKNLVCKYG